MGIQTGSGSIKVWGKDLFSFSIKESPEDNTILLTFPKAQYKDIPIRASAISDVLEAELDGLIESVEVKPLEELDEKDLAKGRIPIGVRIQIRLRGEVAHKVLVNPSGEELVLEFNAVEARAVQTHEGETGSFEILRLQWARASEIASILRRFVNYGDRIIQVDERLNRLIIYKEKEEYKALVALARQLDAPSPQVMIEAQIVEINVKAAQQLGISLGGTLTTVFKEQTDSYNGIELALQPLLRSPLEIRATIDMLAGDGNAQVLAAPKVATLDGVPAEVKTEERFPVFIRETSGDRTYQVKQDIVAGISLSITPYCAEDGMITTKITTKVTSITGTTSEGYPTTSTREVKTMVQAASGQAIVIGGLLEKRTIESTDKIPLLGDIPWLGRVFSNVRNEEKETNLWVIITPYLIDVGGR